MENDIKLEFFAMCLDREIYEWSNETGEGKHVCSTSYDQTWTADSLTKLLNKVSHSITWDENHRPECCGNHWSVSVVEDGNGCPDKNGKYLANYLLQIQMRTVTTVTEEMIPTLS
jgi:hypothetical protein